MSVPPAELPPPDRSAREIREAAEEILRRPEFRDDRSVYERITDWLSDRLSEVLGALTGGGRGAFIAWALFALAAAAIAYLVWRIVRDGAARSDRRVAAGASVAVEHAAQSAAAWRADADAHAAAGRWRDAVRCRWRALVAELVERRAIEDVPGTTSGEYRRLVAAAAPAAAEPFSAGTEVFEHAWYGDGDVDAGDHDRLVEAAARIAATAHGGGAPTAEHSAAAGEARR